MAFLGRCYRHVRLRRGSGADPGPGGEIISLLRPENASGHHDRCKDTEEDFDGGEKRETDRAEGWDKSIVRLAFSL